MSFQPANVAAENETIPIYQVQEERKKERMKNWCWKYQSSDEVVDRLNENSVKAPTMAKEA